MMLNLIVMVTVTADPPSAPDSLTMDDTPTNGNSDVQFSCSIQSSSTVNVQHTVIWYSDAAQVSEDALTVGSTSSTISASDFTTNIFRKTVRFLSFFSNYHVVTVVQNFG